MRNTKKNLAVSFYLLAVIGLGLSSLFIGRRIADRQKEIIPSEVEAADCIQCCWEENCDSGDPDCYGPGIDQRSGCRKCKMQRERDCDKDGYWWAEGCHAHMCPSPPTPTPTPAPRNTPTPTPTNTPIPTPTPPPGCWDTCTPGTCPQTPQALDCQDVDGLRCVNPICPSESNCECPVLACLDLTVTSIALVDGDEVDFTCKGSSGVDQPVNHVEFRAQIEGGTWQSLGTVPATKTGDEYEGTISYTVPQTGSYQIECRVCTSADDSQCTLWGKAE